MEIIAQSLSQKTSSQVIGEQDVMSKYLAKQLDDKFVYLDLEVGKENESIFCMGLESSHWAKEISAKRLQEEEEHNGLISLRKNGFVICGHNFRRFDSLYFFKKYPEFRPWLVIDTLELSVIFQPIKLFHKLQKNYKPSNYALNNPLEDARATKHLLHDLLMCFLDKPLSLQETYRWLLTCGTEEADSAYQELFGLLNFEKDIPPTLSALPKEAITEFEQNYLQWFFENGASQSFNCRLCVAALIAWKYESHQTTNAPAMAKWLTHLEEFPEILEKLCPLMPDKFTYHSYLENFGLKFFKHEQEEVVQAVLRGMNPLVVIATGGGKSLCYQLPALMLSCTQKGFTVVISPLQALMVDQVNGLTEKGLDFATFINGNISPKERQKRLEQLRNGEKDLLYISPEQLRSLSIRELLQERLPSLVVFDEAHCISQWGHDFRPDYRYAPKFISELYQNQQRELPLMAFMTATATVDVREDIKSLFAEHHILINEICSSSVRTNLTYEIIPTSKQAKEQTLITEVKNAITLGGAVLVYTATRKNTERLTKLLAQNYIEARFYHGKIPKEDKNEILQKFKTKELNVIVATCAFGMGIDRSDVRAVIHHVMSGNLESYVQETGRAGRDNNRAICTLLFDPQDAETLFKLQRFNQLSEPEIRNLFLAVRELRDRIYGKEKVSEEYFWVTTNEIFQTSDLDEEFASQDEQRNTKIKVALHYLETFGMIERAENQSSFIEFDLTHSVSEESLKTFDCYAYKHNLPNYRKAEFRPLILAMHYAKAYCQYQDAPYPLEKLSDDSGLSIKELKHRIKELQKAEVCTLKIPTTILITKIDKGNRKNDTRTKYEKHRSLEKQINEEIINLIGDHQEIQINCRALATRLDPDRKHKLSSGIILEILEGWNFLKWIHYKKVRSDVVKITKFAVPEHFAHYQNLINAIIDVLYQALGEEKGTCLRLSQDLVVTLSIINQIASPQAWELEDLEQALTWMHRHTLIRLTDGLNLCHQSMKVRVIKGSQKDKVTREYPKKVKPHYDEQTRRTHIMLNYGQQHQQPEFYPQEYIANYFSLPKSQFSIQYPKTDGEEAKRPVTQEDYDQIINPLNLLQREIVLCEFPAISVIAGPGSGKTRTIVHRIAYLVKVKRVDPARIIALA